MNMYILHIFSGLPKFDREILFLCSRLSVNGLDPEVGWAICTKVGTNWWGTACPSQGESLWNLSAYEILPSQIQHL